MELGYWHVCLCSFVFTRLPLRLCYALAEIVADIFYAVCPRLRDDIKRSAANVLGQNKSSRDVSRVARRRLRNYAKYVVELFRYTRCPAKLEGKVLFEGLDKLDTALKEGKGVILVSLHLGSWEVAGTFLAQRYRPTNVVVRSSYSSDRLRKFMHNLYYRVGIAAISAKDGIRQAAEALRRNELVALMIDAPTKGRVVKVRFHEGYAQFSAGVAALAVRTKTTVVPGCLVRLPDNTFRGFIGEKVEFCFSGDFRSDIQSYTQSILDSLEGFVKQYPEQWGMLHQVWCD
jgi:lauroyl/myristoyl acyltransferase